MGELAPPNGRTCPEVGQVRPAAAIFFTARFCQNRVHDLGENRILGRHYLGLYSLYMIKHDLPAKEMTALEGREKNGANSPRSPLHS